MRKKKKIKLIHYNTVSHFITMNCKYFFLFSFLKFLMEWKKSFKLEYNCDNTLEKIIL
ncbi:hypothetical protein H8356DRAFT_103431 [Neocallimastix lanati (nom. inval.)]|uniref:Uncharacterized protein n=1 Tax=Neocallimastix californiae TaxID=1754190 RepID=A0A1Y2F5T8_9FUNG|nr:hypothetical protein H8356DRAFT_103431 [Neocallimastix sp. JGI-2020a]ORY79251.1 hypothetical protein LY90DRAFT_62527 [Neocallimastix californiae]|eukprot:ORY79251.1 hypothetical protein LY90DRAFT_62527 [Neocallimastix californiae]